MLLFAHTGITLGCALIATNLLKKSCSQQSSLQDNIASVASLAPQQDCVTNCNNKRTSWLTSLITRIDLRFVLLGSLLPDIIDKPVGGFFFQDFFSNSRIFSHTLLFLIALTIASVFLYRKQGKTWLAAISFGTFVHLILDSMWLEPKTLLWPLYGFAFERVNLSHWLQNIVDALLSNPGVYIPEIAGAIILVTFLTWMIKRQHLYAFIKSGAV